MKYNKIPFLLYDCFTDKQFGGNIGGIVFNAKNISKKIMQKIANEINVPVTGFVIVQNSKKIETRIFMPKSEINMCGHVTIGLFTYLSHLNSNKNFVMKT